MDPIIPSYEFDEITKELKRKPLTVNKYRNIAGEGKSQTLGLVNRRCLPVDYSRQCWLRPKLLYLLQEFAKKYVTIPWTSITVNENYRASPHRDKGNQGESLLVAFGNYTGGELKIHEGSLEGTYNICCRPIKTDFSKVLHSVTEFTGERYSLVFYTLKTLRMPKEPLPPGLAVFENGQYVFKRGDKIITPKEGLDHPLKGRKKQKKEKAMIVKQSGNFTLEFE